VNKGVAKTLRNLGRSLSRGASIICSLFLSNQQRNYLDSITTTLLSHTIQSSTAIKFLTSIPLQIEEWIGTGVLFALYFRSALSMYD